MDPTSAVYARAMSLRSALVVGTMACLFVLSGCQAPSPVAEAPPAPIPAPSEQTPTTTRDSAIPLFAEACDTWDTGQLEWRELGSSTTSTVSEPSGFEIEVRQTPLPSGPASRYNAAVEICPGFLWVLSHEGTSRFVALDTEVWAAGPTLTTSGETGNISVRGVSAGGPAWGFRDALAVGNALYLSDAVIDTSKDCVRVDVHRVDTASLLDSSPESHVIYSSDPCVPYLDEWRSRAPLKTHFGGALAYSQDLNELYVSIGDFHLAASAIGQAEAVGPAGLEADYAILLDPEAAVSAVVAISSPESGATSRIFAKGLRNSLGIAHSLDGDLWLSDHGPRGGDEINLITDGSDYGWPLASAGIPYDRSEWPAESTRLFGSWLSFTTHDVPGVTGPEFVWTPAQAPSELVLYNPENAEFPEFVGEMLMGTLRGEALIRLSRDASGVITESRMPLGERIRDLTVTQSGQIIALTDSSQMLILGMKVGP